MLCLRSLRTMRKYYLLVLSLLLIKTYVIEQFLTISSKSVHKLTEPDLLGINVIKHLFTQQAVEILENEGKYVPFVLLSQI